MSEARMTELMEAVHGPGTMAHTPVTVGQVTGAALAANPLRKSALFVNDSDTVIYLKVGATAALNAGIRLGANGGWFEMSAAYGNLSLAAVNAISSADNKKLLVTEVS